MRRQTVRLLLSNAISLTSAALAWVWYDWRLALVLFLALWGHNVERHSA